MKEMKTTWRLETAWILLGGICASSILLIPLVDLNRWGSQLCGVALGVSFELLSCSLSATLFHSMVTHVRPSRGSVLLGLGAKAALLFLALVVAARIDGTTALFFALAVAAFVIGGGIGVAILHKLRRGRNEALP